jgi:hypothetical protein
MSNNETCQRFAEELTGNGSLSEACRAHLDTCPECQAFAATVQAMKSESSAYSRAEIEPLRRNVIKRLEASPFYTRRPASDGNSLVERVLEFIMPWRFTLGFVTAVVLIAVITVFSQSGSSVLPVPVVPTDAPVTTLAFHIESEATPDYSPLPAGSRFELAQGQAVLHGPNRTRLHVQGPVAITPDEHGFILHSGQVRAEVTPGQTTYTGTTPHGTVEVLGTIFECVVGESATKVSVISGKVKVLPFGGEAVILETDQTTEMTLQPAASEVDHASKTYSPITDLQGE